MVLLLFEECINEIMVDVDFDEELESYFEKLFGVLDYVEMIGVDDDVVLFIDDVCE